MPRTQLYDRVIADLLGLPRNGTSGVDGTRAAELLPLLAEVSLGLFEQTSGRQAFAVKPLLERLAASARRPVPEGLAVQELLRLTPQQQAGYLMEERGTTHTPYAPCSRARCS